MTLVLFSGARGKMIHEKNQKQKISWHCSFKNSQVISTQIVRPTLVKTYVRDNLGVKKSWTLEISTTCIYCDILRGPRLRLNGNTQICKFPAAKLTMSRIFGTFIVKKFWCTVQRLWEEMDFRGYMDPCADCRVKSSTPSHPSAPHPEQQNCITIFPHRNLPEQLPTPIKGHRHEMQILFSHAESLRVFQVCLPLS